MSLTFEEFMALIEPSLLPKVERQPDEPRRKPQPSSCPCHHCDGTGVSHWSRPACRHCGGTGRLHIR